MKTLMSVCPQGTVLCSLCQHWLNSWSFTANNWGQILLESNKKPLNNGEIFATVDENIFLKEKYFKLNRIFWKKFDQFFWQKIKVEKVEHYESGKGFYNVLSVFLFLDFSKKCIKKINKRWQCKTYYNMNWDFKPCTQIILLRFVM